MTAMLGQMATILVHGNRVGLLAVQKHNNMISPGAPVPHFLYRGVANETILSCVFLSLWECCGCWLMAFILRILYKTQLIHFLQHGENQRRRGDAIACNPNLSGLVCREKEWDSVLVLRHRTNSAVLSWMQHCYQ